MSCVLGIVSARSSRCGTGEPVNSPCTDSPGPRLARITVKSIRAERNRPESNHLGAVGAIPRPVSMPVQWPVDKPAQGPSCRSSATRDAVVQEDGQPDVRCPLPSECRPERRLPRDCNRSHSGCSAEACANPSDVDPDPPDPRPTDRGFYSGLSGRSVYRMPVSIEKSVRVKRPAKTRTRLGSSLLSIRPVGRACAPSTRPGRKPKPIAPLTVESATRPATDCLARRGA